MNFYQYTIVFFKVIIVLIASIEIRNLIMSHISLHNFFSPSRFIADKMCVKVVPILWETGLDFEKPVPSSFVFVRYQWSTNQTGKYELVFRERRYALLDFIQRFRWD